jgi:hypothetical protein
MEYRNSRNQFMKRLISVFSFIGLAILLITTTAVLVQIIAVLALVGGGIWCVHKLISIIKSKIHLKTAAHHKSKEKLVVEIVTDPEIKDLFSNKNIIDVSYEEVKE